jgi:hypothetical protein
MTFVVTQRFTTRVVGWFRNRRESAARQHIHGYVSPRPVAMVTASLGGHVRPVAGRCW